MLIIYVGHFLMSIKYKPLFFSANKGTVSAKALSLRLKSR